MFKYIRNIYHDYHCLDLFLLSLYNGDITGTMSNCTKFNILYFCYEVNPVVLNDENEKPMRALMYSDRNQIRNYQRFSAHLFCDTIAQSN